MVKFFIDMEMSFVYGIVLLEVEEVDKKMIFVDMIIFSLLIFLKLEKKLNVVIKEEYVKGLI